MSRAIAQRLADILGAIAAVNQAERLLLAAEERGDDLLMGVAFDAIRYNLVVVGEATKALDPEILSRHPEIPWSSTARMRDVLTHQYFRVRPDVVRATIDEPLRELRRVCEEERLTVGE